MTRYVALRIPREFKDWLVKRKLSMEKVSFNWGFNRRIPLTKVMRIISQTDGITIDDMIIKSNLNKIKIRRL